jgi:hypothetical protein
MTSLDIFDEFVHHVLILSIAYLVELWPFALRSRGISFL